jgi:hypothetical protein
MRNSIIVGSHYYRDETNDSPRDNNKNNQNQRFDDEDDEDSEHNNSKDDDEDDWLWSKKETFCEHKKTYDILKEKYQSFITKLPFCIPFDFGFMVKITIPGKDKICWCPSQKNRFNVFCTMFEIDQTCPGLVPVHKNLRHMGFINVYKQKAMIMQIQNYRHCIV